MITSYLRRRKVEAIFSLTEGGLNTVKFGSSIKRTKKKPAFESLMLSLKSLSTLCEGIKLKLTANGIVAGIHAHANRPMDLHSD